MELAMLITALMLIQSNNEKPNRRRSVRDVLISLSIAAGILFAAGWFLHSVVYGAECYTNTTNHSQNLVCKNANGSAYAALVGGSSTICGGQCMVDPHNTLKRECSPKLIGYIRRCDAAGCDVQLADGTYGKTTKWPVEFAKVHPEVCQ